jgi:hypothetical protein
MNISDEQLNLFEDEEFNENVRSNKKIPFDSDNEIIMQVTQRAADINRIIFSIDKSDISALFNLEEQYRSLLKDLLKYNLLEDENLIDIVNKYVNNNNVDFLRILRRFSYNNHDENKIKSKENINIISEYLNDMKEMVRLFADNFRYKASRNDFSMEKEIGTELEKAKQNIKANHEK